MNLEIDPKLAYKFKEKVHGNNDFVRCYFVDFKQNKNNESNDIWSKICSCMDWLTVAAEGIEIPQQSKNMNKSALEFTHFLITIDMIIEAINNLWLSIGAATKVKQPYKKDNSIFKGYEFGRNFTDEEYFKAIRAWFEVHSVNGNEIELEIEGKRIDARFFSSWASDSTWLNPSKEAAFSLSLYSNNQKAEKIYGGRKEIKVNDLLKFVSLRYNTLGQLMKEIDNLYDDVKKKLQKSPVLLDESKSKISQLNQLYKQAKERQLTKEFYESYITTYKEFLKCDLDKFLPADRELVLNYLIDLKPIIPTYKTILQNVDDSEYEIFEKLNLSSQIYIENSYDFGKVLEYADGYGSSTSSEISLKILIKQGVLPEYSVNLSGSCLSLLIHALDYNHNKIHPSKLEKKEFIQTNIDLSSLVSIVPKTE